MQAQEVAGSAPSGSGYRSQELLPVNLSKSLLPYTLGQRSWMPVPLQKDTNSDVTLHLERFGHSTTPLFLGA